MGKLNESGSVMILSLWVLAVLVCLAGGVTYRSRLNLRLTQYAWDETRLLQAAKKAVMESAYRWSRNTAIQNKSAGFEDENARINLNQASAEVLRRLFGSHASVVPAILDWRSPGGNRNRYEGYGYLCRHAPFKSVRELRLADGITDEIYKDVEPYLTVDTTGEVNVNTASGRVLEAVGFTPSLANKTLWLRSGRDGREGTDDDIVFDSPGALSAQLGARTPLSRPDQEALDGVMKSGLLSARSEVFRTTVTARLEDRPSAALVRVVASGGVGGVRVLQWEELR